nr:helix-turn-helix domain-containing protein [Lacticaseibacillus parakribbianus]
MQHRAIADLNEADFRAVGGGVSVDTYRYHLLADTVAFRFFDQLFRSGGFDVHAFCQQEGISLPTLRRKIAPFKAYMAQCGVTMNAVTWALEGSELRVRLLLLTFYQLAFRGVGWPFGTRRFQQAKADFAAITAADPTWFAPGRATKLDLMVLAVQALRLDNGHALAPNKRWQGVVADAGMTLAPLIYTPSRFATLPQPIRAAERDFYYFCRVHFLSFDAAVSPVQDRIMTAFRAGDHAIGRFASGLLDAMIDASDPTTREAAPSRHAVLSINLHRMALSCYVADGAFAKRLDFLRRPEQDADNGRLPQLIRRYFNGLTPGDPASVFHQYYPCLHRDLYSVIAPEFPVLNADHMLNIAVFVDSGTFVNRDLMQFLNGLDFVRLLVPDPKHRPDLIITALSDTGILRAYYGEAALAHIQLVQWATDADDNDFFHLMTVLQHARRT